ncbi:hypothetical protein COO60DRAFT_1539230, partial [Scenedesmus sp. NREL 46B-D3]
MLQRWARQHSRHLAGPATVCILCNWHEDASCHKTEARQSNAHHFGLRNQLSDGSSWGCHCAAADCVGLLCRGMFAAGLTVLLLWAAAPEGPDHQAAHALRCPQVASWWSIGALHGAGLPHPDHLLTGGLWMTETQPHAVVMGQRTQGKSPLNKREEAYARESTV